MWKRSIHLLNIFQIDGVLPWRILLLPEQNLLLWTDEIHNLAWASESDFPELRRNLNGGQTHSRVSFSQIQWYSHTKEPCFSIATLGSVNSYLYLLLVLLVSYTQTYILKNPNSTKKITLEWGSSVVIFLLQLRTSALSFRSFLETSRASSSCICRVRHPIFVKPPSSHALAVMAVMAATTCTTCLITYWCFRCAGFLFTVERLSASRRDLHCGCKWL